MTSSAAFLHKAREATEGWRKMLNSLFLLFIMDHQMTSEEDQLGTTHDKHREKCQSENLEKGTT
jgi:hypothetical protein